MKRRRLAPFVLLAPLLLGLALSGNSLRPAGATPADGPLADPSRMLGTVVRFSEFPDGSPRSRFAYRVEMDALQADLRDSLAAALGERGSADLWAFPPKTPPAAWDPTGAVPARTRFQNVRGFLPGTHPGQGKFVICSHFDATGARSNGWDGWEDSAPGADDNMSGTAAVLELARLLAQDPPLPFDVEFVCFDGEEQGLWGSDTLAAAEKAAGARIFGVLNMDMIGYNPRVDSLVIMTNRSSVYLADYMLETEALAPQPGLTLRSNVKSLVNSDHGPYWENGYPGFMLIEDTEIVTHNPQYHMQSDRASTISRDGAMMARGANVFLNALRRLREDSLGPPRLRTQDQDLIITVNSVIEAPVATPGDTLRFDGGIFNAGGALPAGSGTGVRFYRIVDGRREFTEESELNAPLPTGGHVRVPLQFVLGPEEAGVVTVEFELGDGEDRQVARRSIAIRSEVTRLVRHYMAPNPVRELSRAHLAYELSREGTVRITLFDLHGDEVGREFYQYNGIVAPPGSHVETGLNRVALTELLGGEEPAPGVYLYRIEVFAEDDVEGTATIGKFAILR